MTTEHAARTMKYYSRERAALPQPPMQWHPFDARGIGKRFRHAAIVGALEALRPGETMRFVNDHDPLPLLAQLGTRYGDLLAVSYVQREPGAIVIDFTVAGPAGEDAACGCGCGCG
jgi:uncharacterized protein (DUF2249 family)